MHELLAQLETYRRTAWRYRGAGLAAAAVICLVGWVAVLLMPNKYEVSAKVFLDTSSLLRPVLRGLAVETSARQEAILMVRRTLLTRPNLEAVARTADMDLKTRTPEEMEEVVEGLAKTVKIGGTQRDNIFEIAYENADPQLATRVVEALLNLMVERSLGMSRKDTTKTREFIDQQIKEYEARLVAAENRVKEFRQANMGLMPSDGSGYYERREAVRAQIRDLPHVHLVEPVPLGGELGYYSGEDMPEKSSMMAHADIFLTVYSTMVVETAIHDRPIIGVCLDVPGGWNTPGKFSLPLAQIAEWPTHLRFRQAGAGRVAMTAEELRRLAEINY